MRLAIPMSAVQPSKLEELQGLVSSRRVREIGLRHGPFSNHGPSSSHQKGFSNPKCLEVQPLNLQVLQGLVSSRRVIEIGLAMDHSPSPY